MWERRVGSVLVINKDHKLTGIFTGRDAVRVSAHHKDPTKVTLGDVMTKNPVTITPDARAIDALRVMWDGGFRHVPVVEKNVIWGVVSRGDFKGMEIDRFDDEEHLWECIR
jgi:CBS domain-containing protein